MAAFYLYVPLPGFSVAPLKYRQRNRPEKPCKVSESCKEQAIEMALNQKISVELDQETMRRVHAARDRISAETGLPKVSISGAIASTLKRALPPVAQHDDAENHQ